MWFISFFCRDSHLLQYIATSVWKGRMKLQIVLHSLHLMSVQAVLHCLQPAASVEASSSAAQPASKKRALDIDPPGGASGSAARPATLLEQVEQLGHYPKRYKKPKTDKDRAENSIAEKKAAEKKADRDSHIIEKYTYRTVLNTIFFLNSDTHQARKK